MPEHIVFLTGKLAERNLRGVLEEMAPEEFTYEVVRLPINVAGLMTADFIGRHFPLEPGTVAQSYCCASYNCLSLVCNRPADSRFVIRLLRLLAGLLLAKDKPWP